MSNKYDDGGANAIRGFNYQKAVIAYIAICNLHEDDFYIIPENKEDIEVYKQGKTAYIQVKSSPLSISKLSAKTKIKGESKNNGPSIIAKLIRKEGDSRFKVATTDAFSTKDFKGLIEDKGEFCDRGIYKLSDEQKNTIKEALKVDKAFTDDFIENRIEQIYIMISMFSNNKINATASLLGLMSQKGIKVDNTMGSTSLNELFSQIDNGSEINFKRLDDPTIDKKMIKSEDLKKIFHAVLSDEKVKDIRCAFLDDCLFEAGMHRLINRYFLSIKVKNRNELYEVKSRINDKISNKLLDLDLFFDPSNDCKQLIADLFEDIAIVELGLEVNYSLLLHALAEIAVERGYG